MKRLRPGLGAHPAGRRIPLAILPLASSTADIITVPLRRLKLLEEENRKLKHLVADLSLDKHILQDVLAKKL